MSTKWEPHRYHDEYRDALMKWIEKKSKHTASRAASKPSTKDKKVGSGKVIDMMGLLKKSMQQAHTSDGVKKRKSAPSRKTRKAS
jgi:DNA end-binding protein Ku